MNNDRLTAIATREQGNWVIRFDELDATGVARNTRELPAVARALASLELGVGPTDVDVDVIVLVSDEAESLWLQAERAGEESRTAQRRSALLRRQAASEARKEKYTYDAIGAAFGITAGRVQQLAKPLSESETLELIQLRAVRAQDEGELTAAANTPVGHLARVVRRIALGAADEEDFVRGLQRQELLIRARVAGDRPDVVASYQVALKPSEGHKPEWFSGATLGRDLALGFMRGTYWKYSNDAHVSAAVWHLEK